MKNIFYWFTASVLLVSLLFIILTGTNEAAIVDNSTSSTTSEDSLSFIISSLDSLGNPTTADSLFILVVGPNGAVEFKDSMAIADSRISSTTIRSKQFYSFKEQVSNIDGTGTIGSYAISLLTSNSSLDLQTPNIFSFQIITDEFSDQIALLGDSIFVKGGSVDSNRTEQGGSVDSTTIARAVWNTPQAGHTISGTFGRYLDTEVSSLSSGSGAYAFNLVSFDSVNSQSIPMVSIAIRNLSQSSLIAVGATNSDGVANFNLNSGDYIAITTSTGFQYSSFDTFTVAGTGVDTVFGERFDPGSPVNPLLCRVYGYLFTSGGIASPGAKVTASLINGVARFRWILVSPSILSTTTDSLGYFYFDLIPSDSLTPAGSPYEISIFRTDGAIMRQEIQVPVLTSWNIDW